MGRPKRKDKIWVNNQYVDCPKEISAIANKRVLWMMERWAGQAEPSLSELVRSAYIQGYFDAKYPKEITE